MNQYHIPEERLQDYSMDSTLVTADEVMHIRGCAVCQLKIEEYRVLISAIKIAEIPALEFDLASTVLAKLPEPAISTDDSKLVSLLVLTAVVIIAIPAFIFRSYLLDLIEKSMITTLAILGIGILLILVIQAMDMYRRYQQRMRQLNLY